ncbi:NAD(P)-dependent oxidoreductase [Desulfofundulus thermocisternus]|uniref:NAD(P)-dependent oxidoreductase n=1 Tax=Desulfofundulus thermocisternus TaxID=42471 RepID=UPI00068FE24C|nr:NAD(P)-dependent oxidoreductase [Desulfofundulus thermocisternus]
MRLYLVDDQTLTARALRRELAATLAGWPVSVTVLNVGLGNGGAGLAPVGVKGVREFYGSPAELAGKLAGAEILVVHKAPVTEEVIESAPGLRLIACARAHPVNVDVRAALKRGIPVVHAPGRAADSTADLTMALLLFLARNMRETCRLVSNLGAGAWQYDCRSQLEGVELAGKVLGIIGFGQVGRRVAARAQAFGMNILVYSPHVDPADILAAGGRPVTLEELLSASDFVSLHTRPTPEKRGLIGAPQLALMKSSACLINTARGELVDEEALYRALKEKRIRAAALDVLISEPPPPDHPFFALPNVVLTPHLGGKTEAAPVKAAKIIVEEIVNFLSGKPLHHVINGI